MQTRRSSSTYALCPSKLLLITRQIRRFVFLYNKKRKKSGDSCGSVSGYHCTLCCTKFKRSIELTTMIKPYCHGEANRSNSATSHRDLFVFPKRLRKNPRTEAKRSLANQTIRVRKQLKDLHDAAKEKRVIRIKTVFLAVRMMECHIYIIEVLREYLAYTFK